MESTLTKTNKNKYELVVELGKTDLTGYVERAERNIANSIQLDGFRKGKAPINEIRKRIDKDALLQESMELAVRDSLARTLKEKDLEVLQVTDLKVKENSPDKLIYSAILTLFPEVKLGDFKTIKVEPKKVTITDEDIKNTLVSLQDSRAKIEPKDGQLAYGDRAEVDFEVTKDGAPIEGGVSKSHPVVIGSKNFIPGFEDNLVGLKSGDEKQFSLAAPEDYFAKELAGKNLDFKVKVIATQKITKPNLDDEFAKSLGKFDSLESLKNNLRNSITQEKEDKEKQRVRLAILSEIAEKSSIEVPDDMVEQKLDDMINVFSRDLEGKGMELALYLAHIGKTQDDLRKDWNADALRQVKYYLILQRLARDKEIKVSDHEVQEVANQRIQILAMYGQKPDEINIERVKEVIANELITEKTFEYLEKNCVTT